MPRPDPLTNGGKGESLSRCWTLENLKLRHSGRFRATGRPRNGEA
jgi:hypothetical protein